MFGIGPPELIVIFLIILILFGAKRLPELARSLGRSINEFKNATQNIKNDLDVSKDDPAISQENSTDKKSNQQTTAKEAKKGNSDNLAG
jgi:sec-independent protein translocase protein TatA